MEEEGQCSKQIGILLHSSIQDITRVFLNVNNLMNIIISLYFVDLIVFLLYTEDLLSE